MVASRQPGLFAPDVLHGAIAPEAHGVFAPEAHGVFAPGPSTHEALAAESIGRRQFLKWLGNKQRMAKAICGHFPRDFGRYFEPFVGSGAVLGTLVPQRGVAGDALPPLIALWQWLQNDPDSLVSAYAERHAQLVGPDRVEAYLAIRARYNAAPNPADLLALARSCYGGVIRFDLRGQMNTPCGVHVPIPPHDFAARCALWRPRVAGTRFVQADFAELLSDAQPGDLVYCDPPYADAQRTLYGAQAFGLDRLWQTVDQLRGRGVRVALSIDGSKRSGRHDCGVVVPDGLFAREVQVVVGNSMLRRFQRSGQTMEGEQVADRLLLTW